MTASESSQENSSGADLVSIIVRSDGRRPALFREAVRSILDQTYAPIEVVIVEDGGTRLSGLVDDLRGHTDVAIRYQSIAASGRSRAGNAGLDMAHGVNLGFLDDDDMLLPHHVATLVAALDEDESADAAYAMAYEVATRHLAAGDGTPREVRRRQVGRPDFLRALLFVANFLPIQTVLFRRALFDRLGGFDETLAYFEDWELWLRYSLAARFRPVPTVTSMYRVPAETEVLRRRAAAHEPERRKVLAKHAASSITMTGAEIAALWRDVLDRRDELISARYAVGRILRRLRRGAADPFG